MRIKIVIIMLITVLLSSSCGCWDYKEYEELSMVSALGFDTDGTTCQVTVTVEYLVPGGSSSQAAGGGAKISTGSAVVKATGLSIDDALMKIQQVTERKLFFGYMQEIVIGENAAKQITTDIIGYIDRTPNIRTSSYLAIAKGKAEEVLSTADPNVNEPTSKSIHDLIDQTINTGSAFPVTIQDFEECLAISGEEPVAPEITAEEMEQSQSSTSSDNSSATSSGTSSGDSSADSFDNSGNSINTGAVELNIPKKGYEKIDGIAVFQGDKLVGWLKENECKGLGWIYNQKLNPYEIVKTSSENNIANNLIFRVTRSSCKIKINIENGKPVIYINAYVESDLRKFSSNVNADFLTPDVINLLEKGLADNVRNDITSAIEKGQKELKTDVFNVGFNFYRQYPELWYSQYEKSWTQIFPTLKVNVNVEAKVIDTGTNIRKFSGK